MLKMFRIAFIIGAGTMAVSASPIFSVLPGGSLTAVIVNSDATAPPSFFAFDLRGNSNVAVFDRFFVGAFNVSDGGAPFPNGQLLAQTFDAVQRITLNYTALSLVGTELFVSETGTPQGVVTDAALNALVGKTIFDFSFVTTASGGGFTASYFLLSGITQDLTQVPEPDFAWATILAIPLMVIYANRCRRT